MKIINENVILTVSLVMTISINLVWYYDLPIK